MTDKKISFPEFVSLMALFVAIMALSIDTILPAMFLIEKDLNVTKANEIQFIIGILFLGFTFGQIIFGPISDSFGRKSTIYIGLIIFIIGNVLSLGASDFSTMLIGRFLQGFGASSPRVVSLAVVRDRYQGREMARVMSFIMSVFIIVPVIAPSIGQVLLLFSTWHSIFILLLIAALVAFVWTYFRLPETLKREDLKPFNLKTIFTDFVKVVSNKITLGYAICAGLIFGALIGYLNTSWMIFQQYFLVGNLFPLYFAISALSIGAASLTNSMIVRKYGMHLICHYSLITVIITSAIFFALIYNLQEKIQLVYFVIYVAIIFFCMGLLFGNLNALAMEPMGHYAGMASAIIGSISSAISLVIGTTIGQSYNNSPSTLVLGFLCLGILAFIIQFYLSHLKNKIIKFNN